MKLSFKQFLCEQEDVVHKEDIIQYIRTNCQPFLKEANRLHPLYRGISLGEDDENPYFVLSPRENRTPKDTPTNLHNIADDWFLQKFGHRYRSHAVFGCGDKCQAGEYGTPYYLFPVGEFSFCWSSSYFDMFVKLEKILHTFDDENARDLLISFLERGNYQNTDLKDACRFGHEIMINCEKYILVNPTFASWEEFFK